MTEKHPGYIATPESAPSFEERLSADFEKDFRNSFRFSQGNPMLQVNIFTLMRDYYQSAGWSYATLSPAIMTLAGRLRQLDLPPGHIDIHVSKREEFGGALENLMECLASRDVMPMCWNSKVGHVVPLPVSKDERLKLLLEDTAEQDALYLVPGQRYAAEGRPRINPAADRRESFFRKYIVNGADTHSLAFNSIFAEARRVLTSEYAPSDFAWLQEAWESHHPGQEYKTGPAAT